MQHVESYMVLHKLLNFNDLKFSYVNNVDVYIYRLNVNIKLYSIYIVLVNVICKGL